MAYYTASSIILLALCFLAMLLYVPRMTIFGSGVHTGQHPLSLASAFPAYANGAGEYVFYDVCGNNNSGAHDGVRENASSSWVVRLIYP